MASDSPFALVNPTAPAQRSPGDALLLDSSGTPIPLTMEAAPMPVLLPETYADRFRDYPSRDLTPKRLAEILDEADTGWPRRLIELEEEVLEKDSKIGAVFQLRAAAVLSTYREVIAADDSAEAAGYAAWVREKIDQVNFEEMLANQLDANPKPFAVTAIEWSTEGENIPLHFTPLPQTHFRWAIGFDQLLYFPNAYRPQDAAALPPYSTVRSIFSGARRDHPTRAGLLRPILWLYLFKSYALKDWVSWAERYGMPFRIAKIARDDFQNADLFKKVRQSMKTLGVEASGIFPSDSQLELIQAHGGDGIYKALIDHIETAIAQAVLGHELSSQASRGGNYGVSAAKEVRKDILAHDCEAIASDVYRDVFVPMVGYNFGWDKIELAPQLYFRYETPDDLVSLANTYKTIAQTFPDLPWSRQQIRKNFSIERPKEVDLEEQDNDVILPALPKATPFGGMTLKDGELVPLESSTDEEAQNAAAREWWEAAGKGKAGAVLGQNALDRIFERAAEASTKEILAMRKDLKTLITRAADENWGVQRVALELARLYPNISVEKTRKQATQAFALARLYGRTKHNAAARRAADKKRGTGPKGAATFKAGASAGYKASQAARAKAMKGSGSGITGVSKAAARNAVRAGRKGI